MGFRTVPMDGKRLTRAEAVRGFTPHFAIDKLRWWKVRVDPMTITLASQQCFVVEREPRGQAAQGKMSAKLKLVLTRKNAYSQLDADSVTVPRARWCRGRAIPARLGAGAATRPIGG